jgi:chromosomal replication initiation ATPase DnaA
MNTLAQLEARIARLEQSLLPSIHTAAEAASTIDAITRAVSFEFGVRSDRLRSPCRDQDTAIARQAAFYLARKLSSLSTTVIGRSFNRGHGAVCYGITATQNRIDTNPCFARTVARVEMSVLESFSRLSRSSDLSEQHQWNLADPRYLVPAGSP